MNKVNKNQEALSLFNENLSLISATVSSMFLYLRDSGLCIEIDFVLQYPKGTKLRMRLLDIKELNINYDDPVMFFTITSIKFFAFNECYYLSLDPYDNNEVVSDMDNMVVISPEVEVTIM